jgi:hypothetical protein
MKATANQGVEDDSADADELIIQSLAKLDALAFGISLGVLFGLLVFVATNFLVLKGGEEIGPNLALLSHYFIGYEVTPFGSLSGFVYGFLGGFVIGSLIAVLRNFIVAAYVFILKLKGSMSAVNDFIDNP